jgi:hypothetical protein
VLAASISSFFSQDWWQGLGAVGSLIQGVGTIAAVAVAWVVFKRQDRLQERLAEIESERHRLETEVVLQLRLPGPGTSIAEGHHAGAPLEVTNLGSRVAEEVVVVALIGASTPL